MLHIEPFVTSLGAQANKRHLTLLSTTHPSMDPDKVLCKTSKAL